jgi:DNA-binding LacI/PurR family transcriptional regulator
VGYDDIEMAEVLGLTTVRQPLYQSGKLGMELLLDLLKGEHAPPSRRLLPTELVVRRTSGAPRTASRLAAAVPVSG